MLFVALVKDDKNRKFNYIYLAGKLSVTLVIPIDIARKHGLDNSQDVIVEETKEGIIIRRKS
jgi:hypothetical protein